MSPGTRRRPRNGRAAPDVSSAGTLTSGPAATCGSRARAAPVSNAAAVGGADREHEHTRRALRASARSRCPRRSRRGGRPCVVTSAITPGRSGTGTRSSTRSPASIAPDRKIAARRARPFEQLRRARRDRRTRRGHVRVPSACTYASSACEHRVAIRREDVEPDRGMTRGDPRHVAKAAGREPEQRAVLGFVRGRDVHQRRRRELRNVADERRPTRRDRRASPTRPRLRSHASSARTVVYSSLAGRRGRRQHPGGADEQVGARRRRCRPVRNRPSGARRRIGCASIRAPARDLVDDRTLHRADVGDDRDARRRATSATTSAIAPTGTATNDDVDAVAACIALGATRSVTAPRSTRASAAFGVAVEADDLVAVLARSASPIDPPTRPVPMTAMRMPSLLGEVVAQRRAPRRDRRDAGRRAACSP